MGVKQDFYLDTGPAPILKGLRQLISDITALIEVLRIGDAFARAADRVEHGWKNLFTIEQKFDTVPCQNRRVGVGRNRRKRRRFAEGDGGKLVNIGNTCAANAEN